MLQYSVAAIHGFTVYLLSVILSVAQLVMITVTIENLDWIQSHKPLMLEWDYRFPGFVFPAIDISSDTDEEDPEIVRRRQITKSSLKVRGGNDRWNSAKATLLKSGDDSMDDGYYSEENQKRIAVQQSMNSTLRRRLSRYQQWVPTFWSVEEEQEQEEALERKQAYDEEDPEREEGEAQDRYYSSRIRRALARTLSSSFGPAITASTAKGKRVTFNEQVLILGRRRSSETTSRRSSLNAMTPMTPVAASSSSPSTFSSAGSEGTASVTSSCASSISGLSATSAVSTLGTSSTSTSDETTGFGSDFSPATAETSTTTVTAPMALSSPMAQEKLVAMAKEEAEYQRRASLTEDTNGSESNSPVSQLNHSQQKPTAPIPPPTASPPTTSPASSANTSPTIGHKTSPAELKRSTSVPMKIGSFLHRHQHLQQQPQEPLLATARHSCTFTDASTVGQNPRVLPAHLTQTGTGPGVISLANILPQQHNRESSEPNGLSPRPSLSLSTRTRRSWSLAMNSSISTPTTTSTDDPDQTSSSSSLGRRGSTGGLFKNKNFMYRIVHPQRYKRELEQQVSERERQRLLTLAQLQRRHILESDGLGSLAGMKVTSASESAALASVNANSSVLCGDAYYYATSAEYVEGLGAENSVISTSYGTSFPEELQKGKSKKNKIPQPRRPASYDFGNDRPIAAWNVPAKCGYGSENETSSSRMSESLEKNNKVVKAQSSGGFFFKRENSKKNESSGPSQKPSSNRLHQLFSHPGQKQTQSTSSLLGPPGSAAAFGTAAAVPLQDGDVTARPTTPVFSSSATAGTHRLLARARSNSRTFTSFTALGMPAYPPAATPAIATLPMMCNSNNSSCSSVSSAPQLSQQQKRQQDREMEHTSFAAFGFPSPTTSPVNSAPASPRHSTSSMPVDTPSRIQAVNDFHANVIRRHPFLEADYLLEQDQHRYQRQLQHQQQYQQQEVLEDPQQQQMNAGYFFAFTAESSDDGEVKTRSRGSSRSHSRESSFSQQHQTQPSVSSEKNELSSMATPPTTPTVAVSVTSEKTSSSRGLGFMKKLSLKKKK
ncbi:hypothetical protein BGZ83_005620 [Gryganskiella cystojenkinii]|nr:hypothetical protein BGZ83_005620 [Gryganskiella cystojenkinii]